MLSTVFSVGYCVTCPDQTLVRLVSALMGRMTIAAAYFVSLQYASELIPTVVRGRGVAMCEVVGGVGILVSPAIVYMVTPFN